jgi:hypothetical protein
VSALGAPPAEPFFRQIDSTAMHITKVKKKPANWGCFCHILRIKPNSPAQKLAAVAIRVATKEIFSVRILALAG